MKYLLLLRPLSDREIKSILSSYNLGETKVLYSSPAYKPSELDNTDNMHVQLPAVLVKDYYRQAMDDFLSFTKRKIIEKSIQDHLTYFGSSFWYYGRLNLYNKYLNTHANYAIIRFVEKEYLQDKKTCLEIYTNDKFIADIAVSDNYKFRYSVEKRNVNISKWIQIISFVSLFILRSIVGLPLLLKNYSRIYKHLFFCNRNNRREPIYSFKRKKVVFQSTLTTYLEEEMYEKPSFLFLSEIYPPSIFNDLLRRKQKSPVFTLYWKKSVYFESFIFLILLNPLNWKRLFFLRKSIKRDILELIQEIDTGSHKVLLKMIDASVIQYLYAYIRELAAESLFNILNIKSFTCVGEYSVKSRSIWRIAKRKNIKTIALQHGCIYSEHMGYIYSMSEDRKEVLPDHTILWGDLFKDILLKNSLYNDSDVVVLGHMRSDYIVMKELEQKGENVKSSKPYSVLYISQYLQKAERELRQKMIHDILKLSVEVPDLSLTIKLHPLEDDREIFYSIAKDLNCTNFKIIDGELYGMLFESDLVIAYNSTVAIEAIYFGKPLIMLDYYNLDHLKLIQQQIAYKASKYSELKKQVVSIMKKELNVFPNASSRENFIKHNIYKIDGNAVKRYMEFIEGSVPHNHQM